MYWNLIGWKHILLVNILAMIPSAEKLVETFMLMVSSKSSLKERSLPLVCNDRHL